MTREGIYGPYYSILRACQHDQRAEGMIRWPDGSRETTRTCYDCQVKARAVRQAIRKAELAARPNDCDRCGAKPHAYTYAQFQLCGRCLKATRGEHMAAAARAGSLAIFATAPMVDTSTWQGPRAVQSRARTTETLAAI